MSSPVSSNVPTTGMHLFAVAEHGVHLDAVTVSTGSLDRSIAQDLATGQPYVPQHDSQAHSEANTSRVFYHLDSPSYTQIATTGNGVQIARQLGASLSGHKTGDDLVIRTGPLADSIDIKTNSDHTVTINVANSLGESKIIIADHPGVHVRLDAGAGNDTIDTHAAKGTEFDVTTDMNDGGNPVSLGGRSVK